MEKQCFKCSKTKPLEMFYKHPQMADGRLNKCKACTQKDVKDRYASPEGRKKVRAYEKERTQDPARKKAALVYQSRRRAKNPGKNRARNAVSNALRDGRLIRQPCEECGDPKSQAHHSDYRRPLFVRWLCFQHHREIEHGQTVGEK